MSLFRHHSGSDNRQREPRRPQRTPVPRRPPANLPPARPFRTLAFWVFVALLALVAYRMYQGNFMATPRIEVSYTRFIQEVERGNVQNLQIIEKVVTGELKSEVPVRPNVPEPRFKAFRTNILGDGSDLPDRVWKTNPGIEIEVRSAGFNWISFLVTSLPFLLLLPFWLLLMRQVQSGGSAALKFGKSKAKVLIESTPKVTFKDVAGCDEAKQELQEIIEFLKEPQKFQRLGGRIPKGALLLGPPGSGKTLLAKAVAGEANVPFFSMSGSDFVEMFVGVGASRVRDLFEQGKRNAPCLTGDTVVTLSGGRQVTMREMFENAMVGVKVPAMTEDFRFEDATVLGITRKPASEVFKISTSTSEIRATGNHLFPVLRHSGMEWERADRLTTEDHLAVPRVTAKDWNEQVALEDGGHMSAHEHGVATHSKTTSQTVLEERARSATQGVAVADVSQEIRDMAHSAVVWARIRSIEHVFSREPVYDLCLERHHSFIANDLVTHNCIIFVDEVDAVGRHRGAGLGGGHDEREQTLNQLLVEMDGFDSNEGVIMIAATNRPDVLDPALLRPGRFDRQIVVDWPDVRGREGIFRVHTRNIPLSEDVDLNYLARATPGMAGADIANLVNEAALLAARRNRKKVTLRDFEDAKDKVMLGMERKSLVMTDEERRSTAYHEAGHALVTWLLPGSEPVDKVTIIPRGRALGLTSYVPREERYSRSKEDLERYLCSAMGGRAAEQLIFSHLTTGAANDLERATALARRMVCELGMSDSLGPLTFGKKEEMVFLGREIATHKDYSEQTAVLIDQEVRAIIDKAYKQAMELLKENTDKLHLLANALLEREVLDGEDMDRLLRGETLEPLPPPDDVTPTAAAAQEEPATKERPVEAFTPPPHPRPAGA